MYEPMVYLLFGRLMASGMVGKLRSEKITTEGILSRKLIFKLFFLIYEQKITALIDNH